MKTRSTRRKKLRIIQRLVRGPTDDGDQIKRHNARVDAEEAIVRHERGAVGVVQRRGRIARVHQLGVDGDLLEGEGALLGCGKRVVEIRRGDHAHVVPNLRETGSSVLYGI